MCAGLAQRQIKVMTNRTLIGNKKKLVEDGSEQNLIHVQLNYNWQWKELGLGWLTEDFDLFSIEF